MVEKYEENNRKIWLKGQQGTKESPENPYKERYKIMSTVTFRAVMPEFKSRRLPVRQDKHSLDSWCEWGQERKSLPLEADEEGTGLGQWFPSQLKPSRQLTTEGPRAVT